MPEDQTRHDAIRLYTFLKEFTELRTQTVRSVDAYDEVLWLADIPREPECECAAWDRSSTEEASETWLEIHRPKVPRTPAPPTVLVPWIVEAELADPGIDLPEPRPEAVIGVRDAEGNDRFETRRVNDHPEIKQTWERYIEQQWWPWRGERRRVDPIQSVYTTLFSIYQKQQRLGEQYEVVLGLGLLNWRLPSGQPVHRHLVVAHAQIAFDSHRGVITVGPGVEGAKPALEQDMLDPQYRPSPDELRALAARTEEIADQIWDPTLVDPVLKAWVQSASPRGAFNAAFSPEDRLETDPQVFLAPALILRKRTERSLLRAFDEIIAHLKDGAAVPEGVAQFVTIPDNRRGMGEGEPAASSQSDSEVYFPLEANEAQRRIVERLATNQGVLVQGPPGTGKSHTIVNLVSHLLATGQRVLVTSHTPRALSVLQRYIRERVPEVAPLAVVLLGEGRDALQAMEDSVQGITSKQHTWDRDRAVGQVAELTKQIEDARREQAEALTALRSVRERETYVHPRRPGGYEGTLAKIAMRLRRERPVLEWIQDCPEETAQPPLTSDELAELLRLLRDPKVTEAGGFNPPPADPAGLMGPDDFAELSAAEARAQVAFAADEEIHRRPAYRPIANAPAAQRSELARSLRELLSEVDRLDRQIYKWVQAAVRQILAGQDRAWSELLERTQSHLEAVGDRGKWADETRLTGLGQRDRQVVRADAEALLAHLDKGGGWGVGGPFRPEPARRALYLREEVRIKGRPCDNPQTVRDLLSWLDVEERLRVLRKLWAPHHAMSGSSFTALAADFADLCEPLEDALRLRDRVAEIRRALANVPGLPEPTWHDPKALVTLAECFDAADREEELNALRQLLAAARQILQRAQLHDLVVAFDARDPSRYRAIFEALRRRHAAWVSLQRRNRLSETLVGAAPRLFQELRTTFEQPGWDSRSPQFESAWRWAQTMAWVQRMSDPQAEVQMRLRLDTAGQRIRRRMAEIASAKAWTHCFDRMTEHERQHLIAWSQAMRRIGRGAGRYVQTHRHHAREHMNECRSAIPAWVMPLYRVAETVRAGRDLFDVAIIDEASQSGPEALLLAYLARKLVVVGDDKQISPSYVGVNREDVIHLRRRHLANLPHEDAYGVDQSFFDLAQIRYPGRIRLREHFRCMPEIIQFSNNLCYHGEPLIPLRQYGNGRVKPVVEARPVPGGHLAGSGSKVTNPPEAQAIVSEISRCLQDPRFAGKTFGVISLLGEHQARAIERLLLETVGPEEMERRQLVCGDAYAFQGDERDVMFLSLVSAPTEDRRIGTLTGEADVRRFNVAASRARDQMLLYHTATLNDLSPNCLRHALLKYCQKPMVESASVGSIAIPELRHLATSAERSIVSPPEPFESWFEVDVFLRLVDRGYRVIPQHEVAGYRIDLVVEGMNQRLAVECDGDHWHGPERYELDMGRQRDLERCGWMFWRLRSSAFELDPDASLETLWQALQRAGVHPWEEAAAHAPDSATTLVRDRPSTAGPAPSDGRRSQSDLGTDPDTLAQRSLLDDDQGDDDEGTDELDEPPGTEGADPQLIDATYQQWRGAPLPDPMLVPLGQVIPGLIEIIRIEGPMPAYRACQIYVKGAGRQRVGRQIKKVLYAALRKAITTGLIEATVEEDDASLATQVIRSKGAKAVIVRPRGARRFLDIPPSEVATVVGRLESKARRDLSTSERYRAVLAFYDTKRQTSQIEARLRWIDDHRTQLPGPGRDEGPTPDRVM